MEGRGRLKRPLQIASFSEILLHGRGLISGDCFHARVSIEGRNSRRSVVSVNTNNVSGLPRLASHTAFVLERARKYREIDREDNHAGSPSTGLELAERNTKWQTTRARRGAFSTTRTPLGTTAVACDNVCNCLVWLTLDPPRMAEWCRMALLTLARTVFKNAAGTAYIPESPCRRRREKRAIPRKGALSGGAAGNWAWAQDERGGYLQGTTHITYRNPQLGKVQRSFGEPPLALYP